MNCFIILIYLKKFYRIFIIYFTLSTYPQFDHFGEVNEMV